MTSPAAPGPGDPRSGAGRTLLVQRLLDELTRERFGGPVVRSDRPRPPHAPDTPANAAVRRYWLLTEEDQD